jgi:LPS export ABC transporter protein LptC/lipopolysaccharide transport protein LptA
VSPATRPWNTAPLARRMRLGIAAALAGVALVFLAIFFSREKKPVVWPPSAEKPASAQKIDEREQVRYMEFRGGREKIEFQADRGFVGPDNMYHLVGHVRITDFGRQGGRTILASCDEIIHDAERTRFALTGNVQVRMDRAVFETDILNYDRKEGAFTTDKPIAITSPGFQGSALGMTYSARTEEIWFRSEVRLETRVSARSPRPLVLNGRKLYYSRPIRQGRLEEGVTFSHGRSRGSADSVDFELFPNTDKLNVVYLRGHVRLHLEEEFKDKASGSNSKPNLDSLQSLGDKQDIEADEIKLRAFLDTSVLHSFESKGKASLTFRSSTRGDTRFRAGAIDFIFDDVRGLLREFRAAADVRVLKTGLDGETQTAEGDSMLLPGAEDVLQIMADPGRRVTAHFRGSDLVAEVLGINLRNDDFRGASVRAVFLPGPDKKPVGLFSAKQPVFITSRWMEFTSSAKSYRFYGGSRMWQEKSQLLADEVRLAEDTGAAVGQGAVRSIFPHTPQDGHPRELVEISGGRMHYDPDKNTAIYESEAALKTGAFRLTAQRIRVLLSPETKEPQTITALDQVVITQLNREARGDEANYLLGDRLVILTGRPVVTEKGKGETRGDKLTFRLADGTILVENDKRDRSVTKIKS